MAVTGENDREGQVAIEDQAGVPNNLATGQLLNPLVRPKGFVKLTNGGQGNALGSQSTGLLNKTVNIPSIESVV